MNQPVTNQYAVERVVSPLPTHEDEEFEARVSLRPQCFADYPGQPDLKENIRVYIKAAKEQSKSLDHVILHGAPGLGKTTLARIIAHEMGAPFQFSSGPSLDKPGDLVGLLTHLDKGSVLFIDEIHRLPVKVEEILYTALEDFAVDVLIGQGMTARSVRVDLQPFTLIGATTRLSLLSRPLISRFGIQEKLEFYDVEALGEVLQRSAKLLGVKVSPHSLQMIAQRSRGTPRLAIRLLRRAWDFAVAAGTKMIDEQLANHALSRQGVDAKGFDRTDRKLLRTLSEQYNGGPVGIESLAVSMNEDKFTLEEVYEPFLVYQGMIARTPRGRVLTRAGENYLASMESL